MTFPHGKVNNEAFFSSPVFTLQWHITQACDLHCRHCYDRSSRTSLSLKQSLKVLEDLKAFCRTMSVKGHISFTGGNPFLYPHFFEVYQEANEKGFSTAILGNPVSRKEIEKMAALQKPEFFQVSLEGLPEHNDYIRGTGHFGRTMDFLSLLKQFDIYSMVMLTLTRDNLPQVLPLAELLRDKTGSPFSSTGFPWSEKGPNSSCLLRRIFANFYKPIFRPQKKIRSLGLKDNLFNILFYQNGKDLFGGCAGHGCSGAFNFFALLPHGEVHACRKYPSPIGNSLHQSFEEIYRSEGAETDRAGSQGLFALPDPPGLRRVSGRNFQSGSQLFRRTGPLLFFLSQ